MYTVSLTVLVVLLAFVPALFSGHAWAKRNEPPRLSETIPFVSNTWQFITNKQRFIDRVR